VLTKPAAHAYRGPAGTDAAAPAAPYQKTRAATGGQRNGCQRWLASLPCFSNTTQGWRNMMPERQFNIISDQFFNIYSEQRTTQAQNKTTTNMLPEQCVG